MNKISKKSAILTLVFMLILPLVFSLDYDKDGIPDEEDKYPEDFDNDGIPDKWEIKNGLRYDVFDSNKDFDNDGLSNLEEFKFGTDPHSDDSDGDNIDDYTEINKLGTDPLKKDKAIWPLIVFPALIIIFVLALFLVEKYNLGVILIRKLKYYFSKKEEIQAAQPSKQIHAVEIPDINFRSYKQIYSERERKRKEMENMRRAFGK